MCFKDSKQFIGKKYSHTYVFSFTPVAATCMYKEHLACVGGSNRSLSSYTYAAIGRMDKNEQEVIFRCVRGDLFPFYIMSVSRHFRSKALLNIHK